MPFSARQAVELFHLVFLRALVARGDDKGLFAVKGGCNLRFFFGSVRYSEDLDFDVVVIAKDTLKNRVDRLLVSPTVVAPLRARGIDVIDVSTPKQTQTTQRWKAGLRVAGLPFELRTKLEFSRRGDTHGAAFEAVDANLARAYALSPFLATHYTVVSAVGQKIHALAERSEPQARDVFSACQPEGWHYGDLGHPKPPVLWFDLSHLFALPKPKLRLPAPDRARLDAAIERAMGLSYDDYAAQVVAYLAPDQRELFAGRDAWDAMQDGVVSALAALR